MRMGVGYDRLDRAALARRGVTVCNVPGESLLSLKGLSSRQGTHLLTPDYGTCEIADHAIAIALSLRRGVLLHNDAQRTNPPAPYVFIDTPLISRIRGKVFGILGLGRIGTATALRAKAFGWHVLFYDPYVPNGIDQALGLERTKDIHELFRRSTTLSLHCPHTKETRGMVDYDLMRLMPKGAIFVNTARGEVVALDAVERCLREGIISGVGLDVLPTEPIPADQVPSLIQAYRKREPWLTGRMVLTCHSAYYTPESFADIRVKAAQTMRDNLIDGVPSNVIKPEME